MVDDSDIAQAEKFNETTDIFAKYLKNVFAIVISGVFDSNCWLEHKNEEKWRFFFFHPCLYIASMGLNLRRVEGRQFTGWRDLVWWKFTRMSSHSETDPAGSEIIQETIGERADTIPEAAATWHGLAHV